MKLANFSLATAVAVFALAAPPAQAEGIRWNPSFGLDLQSPTKGFVNQINSTDFVAGGLSYGFLSFSGGRFRLIDIGCAFGVGGQNPAAYLVVAPVSFRVIGRTRGGLYIRPVFTVQRIAYPDVDNYGIGLQLSLRGAIH